MIWKIPQLRVESQQHVWSLPHFSTALAQQLRPLSTTGLEHSSKGVHLEHSSIKWRGRPTPTGDGWLKSDGEPVYPVSGEDIPQREHGIGRAKDKTGTV